MLFEGLPRRCEGFFTAVLLLENTGAFDAVPGFLWRSFFRLLQPRLSSFKITELRRGPGSQSVAIAANAWRSILHFTKRLEEGPGGERAAHLENSEREVIAGDRGETVM